MNARNIAAVSVVALLAGCQMAARSVKPPPLDAEGELRVYLQELPPQADRLRFSLETLAATRSDGQEFPLSIALAELLSTVRSGFRTPPSSRAQKSVKRGQEGGRRGAEAWPEDTLGAAPAA